MSTTETNQWKSTSDLLRWTLWHFVIRISSKEHKLIWFNREWIDFIVCESEFQIIVIAALLQWLWIGRIGVKIVITLINYKILSSGPRLQIFIQMSVEKWMDSTTIYVLSLLVPNIYSLKWYLLRHNLKHETEHIGI